MSRLGVYIKGIYAGELEKKGAQSYVFTYDNAYRTDSGLPALCLNMPKKLVGSYFDRYDYRRKTLSFK